MQETRWGVSIPIGFSSTLQRISDLLRMWSISLFQSLSGFRVRCNHAPGGQPRHPSPGFNPYRVFEYVATTGEHHRAGLGISVSIPIGFSSTLQLPPRTDAARASTSFNPYRVFEYVATIPHMINRRAHLSVSIPIGFSSTLQLQSWAL